MTVGYLRISKTCGGPVSPQLPLHKHWGFDSWHFLGCLLKGWIIQTQVHKGYAISIYQKINTEREHYRVSYDYVIDSY